MGKLATLGIIIAIALLVINIYVASIYVPSMKVAPENISAEAIVEGTFKLINTTTYELESYNVTITGKAETITNLGDVQLLNVSTVVIDRENPDKPPLWQTHSIIAMDKKTLQHVPGFGDINRIGQFGYPIGTEKKDYYFWNMDTESEYKNGNFPAHENLRLSKFFGESEIEGVKTYRFYSEDFRNLGKTVYWYLGAPEDSTEYYTSKYEDEVDPVTGLILDKYGRWNLSLQLSNLTALKEVTSNTRVEGYYTIFNETTLKYDTTNAFAYFNLRTIDKIYDTELNDTVLVVTNWLDLFNKSSGEKVSLPPQIKYIPYQNDYILSKNRKFASKYYSDNRSGYYTLPPFLEKKNYPIMVALVNIPAQAKYTGESVMNNITVYNFNITLRNLFYDEIIIPGYENAKIYLDYNQTSYYEPVLGVELYRSGEIFAVIKFPDLQMLPENLNMTIVQPNVKIWQRVGLTGQEQYTATGYGFVNATTTFFDNYSFPPRKILLIELHKKVVKDSDGSIVDELFDKYAVDAKTCNNVPGYGSNINRDGLFTFPLGTEQKDYYYWNDEINESSLLRFVSVDNSKSIYPFQVYKFQIVANGEKQYPNQKIKENSGGLVDRGYYYTVQTFIVEPYTGLVINKSVHTRWTASLPILGEVDAYKIDYEYTPEMVRDNIYNATLLREQVQLSKSTIMGLKLFYKFSENGAYTNADTVNKLKRQLLLSEKNITVAEVEYHLSDKTKSDAIKTVKELHGMLNIGEFYVPLLLSVISISIAVWCSYKLSLGV